MSDDSQIQIPASFVQLFIAPGRTRPQESRAVIGARHELCEDMAGLLSEHALNKRFELHASEDEVLERMHRGLLADGAGLSAAEAGWVVHRLAELLGWPQPLLPGDEPAR